jgi:hypothetical protein
MKEYRTREQWQEIKKAIMCGEIGTAISLGARWGFWAEDIATHRREDEYRGEFTATWEEILAYVERLTAYRTH